MTVSEMRAYISDAYPGKKWHYRVSKMAPNQVIAVYHNIINKEQIAKTNPVVDIPEKEEFHQLDIFEYMVSKGIKAV